MRTGRKRSLDGAIQKLHQKTLAAYPGVSKDIPIPKSQIVDFLLSVPAQQRGYYMDLLKAMAEIEESKLQDLSHKMVEYYSRYLP